MASSYLEAYRLKNPQEISWNQYIEHLFARCRGFGHEDDSNKHYGHWNLRHEDPFGYSIWRWCKTVPAVKDATPLEDVFITYRRGSADEIKEKLEALPKEYKQGIRKSLAFLALQERRANVLKLCLEKGDFPYESYFEDEANVVEREKDPETFSVLEASHFREIFPRRDGSAGVHSGAKGLRLSGKAKREEELLERARKFDQGGSHPVDW